MEYLIGVVSALAVTGCIGTLVGFDRDRAFYPTVTIVVASYYVLFAVLGGASTTIASESVVMGGFTFISILGFKRNLWFAAGALFVHGVFDFFHGHLITNAGVPASWPMFCLSFDITAAIYLASLLKRSTIRANAP